jgi:hypothetical protein
MACRVVWLVNPFTPVLQAAAFSKSLVQTHRPLRLHFPECLDSTYRKPATICRQKFQYLLRINNITISKARVFEFRCSPDKYFAVISTKDGWPTELSEFTHRAMISRSNRQHDSQYKRERCICCCNLNLVNQDKKMTKEVGNVRIDCRPTYVLVNGINTRVLKMVIKFVKRQELLM